MHINKIEVRNFRLLKEVSLCLEPTSTVIVGRNNSGKTSLTEVFKRLLSTKNPCFSLEDFSIGSIRGFQTALKKKLEGAEDMEIRANLPVIEVKLEIGYDPDSPDLGPLAEFIIDLNVDSTVAVIDIKYQLEDGKIEALFEGADNPSDITLVKKLKERIPNLYSTTILAVDPTDNNNVALKDYVKFINLFGAGFINAQRGLDDITHTEKDVLGKILNRIFKTANDVSAPDELKQKSAEIETVVNEIQEKVDRDFNKKLDTLLPALQIFGYPGLVDPNLSTETTINIGNILESHTKIKYGKGEGLFLPETYNGLGSRNLIYILFQLFDFFTEYQSKAILPGVNVIFIEEPEAHLHPQMQQVFINQLSKISKVFSENLNNSNLWPVQFIVTTHSTHIANEAKFESIRYFLTKGENNLETKIKDLRTEFKSPDLLEDKEFLHKYLTLTRCDLFFADKAMLIEGATERLIMPKMIEKVDRDLPEKQRLNSQYLSIIEVGGAYAHHFYKFLDFLELRTLIITDLDSVEKTVTGVKTTYPASLVHLGTHCSNSGIKNWFEPGGEGLIELTAVVQKTDDEKTTGFRKICFQKPESLSTPCGRSFEDAFMIANVSLFGLSGLVGDELATQAYEKAKGITKTDFALKYALEEDSWNVPLYIKEGLTWLSENPVKSISIATVLPTDVERCQN